MLPRRYAARGSRIHEPFLMSLASQHLKRLYERFRERTVRHRVEIVAVLTIVATLEDWPATDPRSDILSPCAGNSILASQGLRDGRDVTTNCKARHRPYRAG